jgi:hypothetical protein
MCNREGKKQDNYGSKQEGSLKFEEMTPSYSTSLDLHESDDTLCAC